MFDWLPEISIQNWNRIGIVLQTISFVLVTPQFFGVERIQKLEAWLEKIHRQQTLRSLATKFRKWWIDSMGYEMLGASITFVLIIVIVRATSAESQSEALIEMALIALLITLVFVLGLVIPVLVTYFLEFALKLLKPDRDDVVHWMFITGVALFFIASAIQFFAVQ